MNSSHENSHVISPLNTLSCSLSFLHASLLLNAVLNVDTFLIQDLRTWSYSFWQECFQVLAQMFKIQKIFLAQLSEVTCSTSKLFFTSLLTYNLLKTYHICLSMYFCYFLPLESINFISLNH